jgi:competence protein ComEA
MRLPTITRARAIAYAVAIVLVLVVGGRLLIGSAGASNPESRPAGTTIDALAAATDTGSEDVVDLTVHVAGAVRRPGVYLLPEGSRVDDAIRAAGGARPTAALDQVNLAALLIDGQQVIVPRQTAGGAVPAPAASPSAPAAPVNLNTATLEDLDGLPGIGPVTAQKIIDYRAEHGPFASVDELDAIPGIGPARMEQLRELVTV